MHLFSLSLKQEQIISGRANVQQRIVSRIFLEEFGKRLATGEELG